MLVAIIAAMDRRGLIGNEAGLPWHLPNDLRRFRTLTWGKPIIMGRKTFELIGQPLPGRFSIVLSHNPEYHAPGCRVTRTLQEALAAAEEYLKDTGACEAMIIGGGRVYAEAVQRCDRLYLTLVEGDFKGSTYFPVREILCQVWRPACEPETHTADERNPHRHSFHILERVGNSDVLSFRPEDKRPRVSTDPETAPEELDLAALLRRGTVAS
jgi:dihydrofolate reductase